MGGDELITDLQRIAAEFDYYDETEPDVVGVILDALHAAHPKATAEQVLLAIRRAEFELVMMIADVDGWWGPANYDFEAPRWGTLERLKAHAVFLSEAERSIEAAVDDETDYLLAELDDEIGGRMLILRPEDRLAAEIALPPLVMIFDRHDAGPGAFDQPSLDCLLGIAKIFCVRCMRPDNRDGARFVRNTAIGMAAGMSPRAIGDFNAEQRLRPDGPAVLLVICRHDREPPEAWISAWEARGISIYTERDRQQDIDDAHRAAAENGISLDEALAIHVWRKEPKHIAELLEFLHKNRGGDKEPA